MNKNSCFCASICILKSYREENSAWIVRFFVTFFRDPYRLVLFVWIPNLLFFQGADQNALFDSFLTFAIDFNRFWK